jgi:hypothetical protein
VSFDCKTCEEIAKLMLHAAHSDPSFIIGQSHSNCAEPRRLIKKLNAQILEHAKRCRKVKLPKGNVVEFKWSLNGQKKTRSNRR